MSYKIVVARYNEDIGWFKHEMDNCIIYNKGVPLNIQNEVLINNLGRESETYLQYIIANYDTLPDVVVFTQARISDHVKVHDKLGWLISLKNEALIHSTSQNFLVHDDKVKTRNLDWDKDWNLRHGKYYLQDNYKNNQPLIFIDWFTQHIGPNYSTPTKIYVNGLFAVKKELILANPIEYYKRLILELNHHINSTEGHFFERSWYYIFNK